MKKEQAERREIQSAQFEKKKSIRNLNALAKSCVQRDEKYIEKPSAKWNRGGGALGERLQLIGRKSLRK